VETQPIGTELVDNAFLRELDFAYRYRIRTAIDPTNKLYITAYPATGHVDGRPNKMLIYRWDIQRWAKIEGVEIEELFVILAEGLTLEQLDNINTSLDALEAPLDSTAYSDGRMILAGVNADNKVVNFNGAAMTAYIDTAEVELTAGQMAALVSLRPLIEGTEDTSVSCAIIGRNVATGDQVTSDYFVPEANGEVNVEGVDSYRYQKIRTKIEGGFVHALGIADILAEPDGEI
jgi:hypothetical protein